MASGANIICPAPDKGSYLCGLQVRAQMIKTKGKVRHYYADECPNFKDKGYVDFEVEAPYVKNGGPNEAANVAASFEPCILSCENDPGNLDCDGVKSALEKKAPLCPDTASKQDFADGRCTAHIVQRQRWQSIVGDR